jgi:hypothetical protein
MGGERPSRPVGPPTQEDPLAAASGDQRKTTGTDGLSILQTNSAFSLLERLGSALHVRLFLVVSLNFRDGFASF